MGIINFSLSRRVTVSMCAVAALAAGAHGVMIRLDQDADTRHLDAVMRVI